MILYFIILLILYITIIIYLKLITMFNNEETIKTDIAEIKEALAGIATKLQSAIDAGVTPATLADLQPVADQAKTMSQP